MMQVYLTAMEMSKRGKPTYVVEKNLDICVLRHGPSLLQHLREGYEVMGKFVSGAAEYSWRIDNKVHHLAISRVLFGDPNRIKTKLLIISVQEFLNPTNPDDATYRVNVFGWDNGQANHIWESPLDRVANQEAFLEGQKKANVLIELLTIHLREHRDSSVLRLILEEEEKKGWPSSSPTAEW